MAQGGMKNEIKAFEKQLGKWGKKLKGITNKKFRAVSLQALKMVMQKSPVDQGTFRGNWNVGLNNINLSVDTDYKGEGKKYSVDSGAFAAESVVIGRVVLGDTVNISNALPYANRIEFYGWSDQAPSGVVRVTLIELTDWLKKQNEKK